MGREWYPSPVLEGWGVHPTHLAAGEVAGPPSKEIPSRPKKAPPMAEEEERGGGVGVVVPPTHRNHQHRVSGVSYTALTPPSSLAGAMLTPTPRVTWWGGGQVNSKRFWGLGADEKGYGSNLEGGKDDSNSTAKEQSGGETRKGR